jgi:hypothetical protein
MNAAYDAKNRVISPAFSYDANGNVTTIPVYKMIRSHTTVICALIGVSMQPAWSVRSVLSGTDVSTVTRLSLRIAGSATMV